MFQKLLCLADLHLSYDKLNFKNQERFSSITWQGSVDQWYTYIEYYSRYMTTQRVVFKFFCFFMSRLSSLQKRTTNSLFFVSFSRFHKSIFHYCLTPNDKSPLLSCLMSSLKEKEMSKKERKNGCVTLKIDMFFHLLSLVFLASRHYKEEQYWRTQHIVIFNISYPC